MNKKCLGCGVELQTTNKDGLGYTNDLKNKYCRRCFRLKNYGEKRENEEVDESKIINKVNHKEGLVFFLIDFLNLNYDTLEIFKKIKQDKILVVSKSDTLRKEMKYSRIKNWLKSVYEINTPIIFLSNKFKNSSINIFKYMDEYKYQTCFIMGITNAGKSTFINNILKENNINKEILTSNKPNTTLDFIRIKIDKYIVYDTPGFSYLNLNNRTIDKELKLMSYNIKKDTCLIINDMYKFHFWSDNQIVIYTTGCDIKREYKYSLEDEDTVNLIIQDNYDVVLSGIGFINFKKFCQITCNRKVLGGEKTIDIRPSLTSEEYK